MAVKRFVSNSGVRLYQIPCQVFETLTARVYLLLGAGPPTLVDTGSRLEASTRQILAGLEAVGAEFGEAAGPSHIGRILLTHGHGDHVGGLEELLRHTSAEVAIHPLDSKAITAPAEHAVLGRCRLIDLLDRAGVHGPRRAELLSSSPYAEEPDEKAVAMAGPPAAQGPAEPAHGWQPSTGPRRPSFQLPFGPASAERRRGARRAADRPHAGPFAGPRLHRRRRRTAVGRPLAVAHAAPSMAGERVRRTPAWATTSSRWAKSATRAACGWPWPPTNRSFTTCTAGSKSCGRRIGAGWSDCWNWSAARALRFRSLKSPPNCIPS